MDIYRFISSRDMREHLQKINYRFSTPEAAFLVCILPAAVAAASVVVGAGLTALIIVLVKKKKK